MEKEEKISKEKSWIDALPIKLNAVNIILLVVGLIVLLCLIKTFIDCCRCCDVAPTWHYKFVLKWNTYFKLNK